MADLTFEGGDRGGVDDDATLTVGIGCVALHDRSGGLVAEESADEVDLHHASEELAGHGPVAAEHAGRTDDARAVHEQVDAAHRRSRRIHRRVDVGLGADITAQETRLRADLRRCGLARAFLDV